MLILQNYTRPYKDQPPVVPILSNYAVHAHIIYIICTPLTKYKNVLSKHLYYTPI